METRVSRERVEGVIRKLGFKNVIREEAVRFSGGIWFMWSDSGLQVQCLKKHRQFLHIKIYKGGQATQMLTTVYGSSIPSYKEILWEEINSLGDNMTNDWLVNAFISIEEKFGRSFHGSKGCKKF